MRVLQTSPGLVFSLQDVLATSLSANYPPQKLRGSRVSQAAPEAQGRADRGEGGDRARAQTPDPAAGIGARLPAWRGLRPRLPLGARSRRTPSPAAARRMRALAAPDADAAGPRARDAEAPPRRSAAERLAADRAKYVRGLAPEGPAGDPHGPARAPEPVVRRVIARKPLRPDSLVMYRQKCDFVRGSDADAARAGLAKRRVPGPGRDRAAGPAEEGAAGAAGRAGAGEAAAPEAPVPPAPGPPAPPAPGPRPAVPASDLAPSSAAAARGGPELRGARRAGLRRSQSDLSSRFSVSLAELDSFFQFCGLEPDVVEALGRENFSADGERAARRSRCVSVATSDSGFSRRSDEGLQEEELTEQVPSTTSVVERNARIIKWLYTCRKAKEAPRSAPQGPV
ncbi:protein FAM110C [Sorex fumeus]|uniref:protein FAM110C n=1 Tax=Sorex fumeus TaxID=62283 RepID=UPI0024ACBDA1|nr:protein FAM110C [Sorex fumeus]